MKRAEDRLKPGRKELYVRPVSLSLYVPAALLARVQAVHLPGFKSRNSKLVRLLEFALEKLEGDTMSHDTDTPDQ